MTSRTDPANGNLAYSVRESKRARHVRLRVRPFVGLEVVVPKRFPRARIERILQQHRDWISAQLEKHAASLVDPALPDTLELALTGERYRIEYANCLRPQLRLEKDRLIIKTPASANLTQDAVRLLRQWIRKRAQQELPARLAELAADLGFNYARVSIRSQKSRWGSCSSNGTISLNDQLLFMPPDTVDYLLIHELCHTRHMNHSAAYWRLVAQHVPNYKTHERVLDNGREHVPAWFQHDLHRQVGRI